MSLRDIFPLPLAQEDFNDPPAPWTSDALYGLLGVQQAGAAGATTITDAGAIASAVAFGAAQLNLRIFSGAISSLEACGTPTTRFAIAPAEITTAQAFGAASVGFSTTAASIGSAEAFGTPSVAFQLAPAAIASTEAWGSAQLNLRIFIGGIGTSETAGAPTVLQASPQTIEADAIAGAEAFGGASIGEPPRELFFPPPTQGLAKVRHPRTPRLIPATPRPRRLGAIGIPTAEAVGRPELAISRAPQVLEALAFSAVGRAGAPALTRKPSARQLADELEEIFDIAA